MSEVPSTAPEGIAEEHGKPSISEAKILLNLHRAKVADLVIEGFSELPPELRSKKVALHLVTAGYGRQAYDAGILDSFGEAERSEIYSDMVLEGVFSMEELAQHDIEEKEAEMEAADS
ncbi:MAG: hypothetical protein OEY44_04960 [Candidatus Peregrinibacteria bacterium]|nr:hypothetical protein [Candidatus Peregrinibacteria bacterium]